MHDRRTYAVLLLAMMVWGLNLPALKALARWYTPAMQSCLRMVVAAGVLTLLVLWRRRDRLAAVADQLPTLVLCGLLMVYANQILFAQGITLSTATNAALITALNPLVASVLAAIVFRELLTRRRMGGVALGLAGVVAVILSHPQAALSRAGAGDLLLIAGMISFATGGAMVQRLSRDLDPLVISWAVHLTGAFALVVHVLASEPVTARGAIFPGWEPAALVIFSGALATAIASLVWYTAIRRIGVARTSVFFYWVPLFGVAASALLLREQLTAWHFAGAVAVLGGTLLGTTKPAVGREPT